MKRIIRTLTLLCLAALLLGTTVMADWGPKPALTVKLLNAPDELYYLDLLAPGEGGNGMSEDEASSYHLSLLSTLLENVPEDWHACLVQGTHIPIFGKLTSDNGVHHFNYAGVPETYRILIVTGSGEVWSSETLRRKVLQSSVTVDWETGEVRTPPCLCLRPCGQRRVRGCGLVSDGAPLALGGDPVLRRAAFSTD